MKIEHPPGKFEIGALGGDEYEGLDLHASPHECSVPGCPGDLNRRKLELFGEMLARMESDASKQNCTCKLRKLLHFEAPCETCTLRTLIAKAKELK